MKVSKKFLFRILKKFVLILFNYQSIDISIAAAGESAQNVGCLLDHCSYFDIDQDLSFEI